MTLEIGIWSFCGLRFEAEGLRGGLDPPVRDWGLGIHAARYIRQKAEGLAKTRRGPEPRIRKRVGHFRDAGDATQVRSRIPRGWPARRPASHRSAILDCVPTLADR